MVAFNIPAVCPTCRAVFPSGAVLYEGGTFSSNGSEAGPCPNGHMGIIVDGTYSLVDGLYRYFKNPESQYTIREVRLIAEKIASKEKTADSGLDEIACLLPADLGAAVKKLGSKHPITAILILLAVIGSIATIAGSVASIYKTLSPDSPIPPPIIINNNPTIINQNTTGDGSSQSVTNGVTRQQRRQSKKQAEAQQQSERPSGKESPTETGSIAKPSKKPKARNTRKKEKAARRSRFNPRHQRSPACD